MGDEVAVSYRDHGAVKWFAADTGNELARLDLQLEPLLQRPLGVAFTPRGTLLVCSDDKVLEVARTVHPDGTSHFSRTLGEHERAVTKYQRQGRR